MCYTLDWEGGRAHWTSGNLQGELFFDSVNRNLDSIDEIYSATTEGDESLEELRLFIHFALCAQSESEFNDLVEINLRKVCEDCQEHAEWEFVVDGCRDYQEGHWLAFCRLCGGEVSQLFEPHDDPEPDEEGY